MNAFGRCAFFLSAFIASMTSSALVHAQTPPVLLDNVIVFDAPNAVVTQANGINDGDQVVGFFSPANPTLSTTHGFVSNNDGNIFVPFDIVGPPSDGNTTEGNGINNKATTTGYFRDVNGFFHGFIRDTAGTNIIQFDAPNPNGPVFTEGTAINDAGDVTLIANDGNPWNSYLRKADGSFTSIDVPGATSVTAIGINNHEQISGTFTDSAGNHGYIWDAKSGRLTTFDVPNALLTGANGINDAGEVVGAYFDNGGWHGFVRNVDGSFLTFDIPGAVFNRLSSIDATAINNRQQIVGEFTNSSGTHSFFVNLRQLLRGKDQ